MAKLKPCPFCGHTELKTGEKPKKEGIINYFVRCIPCGCEISKNENLERAIKWWNTRAGETNETT